MNFDWYTHQWTLEEKKGFDCYSQIKLLEKDTNKEKAKETHKLIVYGKRKVGKNEKPIDPMYPKLIEEMLVLLETLLLRKPTVDTSNLPLSSFFLQFTFKLAKPYISKDDEAFYICENPVKKDKVFKVPMVSGSTWKGNMRWTAGRLLEMDTNIDERLKKRIRISNLFGNENETEERYFDSLMPEKKADFKTIMRNLSNKEGLRRGRLNFYPTFFDRISLEVINPHDRKTKAGTVPIYIESVPEGATGTFSLLYVPFDLMGKPSEEIKQQVTEDINLVYDSLKEMMFTYGFSAKKSSGFGIIKEGINGIFEMSGKKDTTNQIKPEPIKPTPAKKKTYSNFSELLGSIQPTKQDNSLTFSSFKKLKDIISQVKAEVMKNAG